MIWQILITIGLTVASAAFYRMGGSGRFPRQVRLGGCATCMTVVAGIWLGWHWIMVVSFGAMFGFLSTYWDFINRFFKTDENEYWWNWALHAFMVSLALIAIVFFGHGHWIGFGIRQVVATVLVTIWSQVVGWDVAEECGRGAILTATVPLLLIG